MNRPFAYTLSFDDRELLVLVEDGGATPLEVADSLGMDLKETKALVYDLVHRILLACQVESATSQHTLVRVLQNDEVFSAAAFTAALTRVKSNNQG